MQSYEKVTCCKACEFKNGVDNQRIQLLLIND